MSENVEWDKAVTYQKFLSGARENVETIKARYNDFVLSEDDLSELRSIQNDIRILVLGTERCNDTAGNLPILARIAEVSSKVELRVLDSDKHAELHQTFKVNGKRKTPVVLFLNSNNEELCRWVERPNAAYKIINEATSPSLEERRKALKQLYSDPEIQRQSYYEFMSLLIRADFILGRS
jgi:glutaredoxin